jgi:hypothetical protein
MTRNSNRGYTDLRRDERRTNDNARQASYNDWDGGYYNGQRQSQWEEDDDDADYEGYSQRAAYGRDRDDDMYNDDDYEGEEEYDDDDYGHDRGSAYGDSRRDFAQSGNRNWQNTDYGSGSAQNYGRDQRRQFHDFRESMRTSGLHPDERRGNEYWDSEYHYQTPASRGRRDESYRDSVADERYRTERQGRGQSSGNQQRSSASGYRTDYRDDYNNNDYNRYNNRGNNQGQDQRYTQTSGRQGQRSNSSSDTNYNSSDGRDNGNRRRGFASQRNDRRW